MVQRIEVVGSTIFDQEDFAPLTQSYEGQSLTLEELAAIANRITQLYSDGGYITSRAVLVDQVVREGVVQIRVIEGTLERIDIEGNHHVNTSFIRNRIQLGGNTPLNQIALEEQLRLLRLDPLFEDVGASLRAGSGLGQSILTVRVTEAAPFQMNFGADNYSSPSVGSERFGASVSYRSLTGLGDDLSVGYSRSSTGGSTSYDFSYRLPVNPMNGTIQLRAAPSDYEITDPNFTDIFDIEGNSDLYELSFRQPIVRSPREEFALSIGFTYRNGETFIGFVGETPERDVSTTSVFRFGQDYVLRDQRGSLGIRSQFNLGTGLFNATTDAEVDGQFFSWLGQAQRVQILGSGNQLIMQADLQLSADPLLASQQFVIGGGQSLRGYRQNVRVGDNGFRLSIEDRIAIQRNAAGVPILQLAPFAEFGAVWNSDDNPNSLPEQTLLSSIGLGLLWEPFPRFSIRLDTALPLVNLDDRGVNAQDDGFYFSVNYRP
jgi:hemolysin activation/secretion protein